MTALLNEMETALADLLQSGFATWSFPGRFNRLAADCEAHGLHTGAELLGRIEELLEARTHTLEKDDLPLAAAVCRTVRYIALCREKSREEAILARWQNEGGNL